MRRFLPVVVALSLTVTCCFAAPTEEFSKANNAFLEERFEEAYSGYQKLLDDGHINADLLYNLGNASYRLGRQGEAVLWYERALVVDPTHREARQNLRFLQRTAGLLRFEDDGAGGLPDRFRRDTLVRAATFAGWLCALGIAAAFTLRVGRGTRNALSVASALLAMVAIAAGYGIYLKQQGLDELQSLAIVTKPDSKAFTAPARASSPVIALPPGSELARVSERGNWHYVDLPGELRGWIPQKSVTPLWPYDPALAD